MLIRVPYLQIIYICSVLLARSLYAIDTLIPRSTPLFMGNIRLSSKEEAGVHYVEQQRAMGLS